MYKQKPVSPYVPRQHTPLPKAQACRSASASPYDASGRGTMMPCKRLGPKDSQ